MLELCVLYFTFLISEKNCKIYGVFHSHALLEGYCVMEFFTVCMFYPLDFERIQLDNWLSVQLISGNMSPYGRLADVHRYAPKALSESSAEITFRVTSS